MAVTVNLAQLSDSSTTYLRDVLRTSITDTQSPARTASNWIFEGEPVESRLSGNLPQVYIDLTNQESKRTSLSIATSTKFSQPILEFHIEVWASSSATTNGAQQDRDDIADEIIADLTNPGSTDGTNSIKSQKLVFRDYNMRNADRRITSNRGTGSVIILMRIKEIDMRFRYIGN